MQDFEVLTAMMMMIRLVGYEGVSTDKLLLTLGEVSCLHLEVLRCCR